MKSKKKTGVFSQGFISQDKLFRFFRKSLWSRLDDLSVLPRPIGLGLCLCLAACSGGPRSRVVCQDGVCTLAPVRATSRPYKIKGITYCPQPHYEYDEVGLASYYGGRDIFHGRPTATGERFDMNEVSAAHKTLPLPCVAEVTNLENGRQVQLKINDRGPFVKGRIIDVSRRTAQLLGFYQKGTAKVRVRTLVPESLALNGLDPHAVMLAEAPSEVVDSIGSLIFVEEPHERLPDSLFEDVQSSYDAAPASPPQASGGQEVPRGIFVEVGSYANQVQADSLSKSLERVVDYTAQLIENKGGTPYSVCVGPLQSMERANQVLDHLVDAGHLMSKIVIYR